MTMHRLLQVKERKRPRVDLQRHLMDDDDYQGIKSRRNRVSSSQFSTQMHTWFRVINSHDKVLLLLFSIFSHFMVSRESYSWKHYETKKWRWRENSWGFLWPFTGLVFQSFLRWRWIDKNKEEDHDKDSLSDYRSRLAFQSSNRVFLLLFLYSILFTHSISHVVWLPVMTILSILTSYSKKKLDFHCKRIHFQWEYSKKKMLSPHNPFCLTLQYQPPLFSLIVMHILRLLLYFSFRFYILSYILIWSRSLSFRLIKSFVTLLWNLFLFLFFLTLRDLRVFSWRYTKRGKGRKQVYHVICFCRENG